MKTIQLGFKAFDPHELLCHFVALKAGLYKRENLNIELLDITFITDADLPVPVFQVSCGAALSAALMATPQRVVFVATDKPMFWIYANHEILNLTQLADSKLATFPAIAPPHHLANIILNKSGLDVEKEITLLPARDDVARFGLLKSASVDAAVISSAIAPVKIEQAGFNRLCFFGDEIRIPTTGLAIHQSYLDQEPYLIETLTRILKESLSIIQSDVVLCGSVLQEYFNVDEAFKDETGRLYQGYFTQDGKTTEAIAQNAINSLCKSLSVTTVPQWNQIYNFPE